MFLKAERKDTLAKFETAKEDNKEAHDFLIVSSTHRFELCNEIKETLFPGLKSLDEVFNLTYPRGKYIQTVREFKQQLNVMQTTIESFENIVVDYNRNAEKAKVAASGAVAVAVGAGGACATLGSSAALGLVTTFGTASTGTAISTLSGAAATNAAVAWFGGGALSMGGGGMALGNTVLALSGPIGWGIAAAGVAGGGIFYRSKNKKAIKENIKLTEDVYVHTKKLQLLRIKIDQEVLVHKDRLINANSIVLRMTRELKWFGAEGLGDDFYLNLNLLNELISQMASFMSSRITVE